MRIQHNILELELDLLSFSCKGLPTCDLNRENTLLIFRYYFYKLLVNILNWESIRWQFL